MLQFILLTRTGSRFDQAVLKPHPRTCTFIVARSSVITSHKTDSVYMQTLPYCDEYVCEYRGLFEHSKVDIWFVPEIVLMTIAAVALCVGFMLVCFGLCCMRRLVLSCS